MPTITVRGVITDGERLLLAREAAGWSLPGGLLLDSDSDVEAALARSLGASLGVTVQEHMFLDTLYERVGGSVVVHNVFLIAALDGALVTDEGEGHTWADLNDLAALLPGWLAEPLPVLLGLREPPEQSAADLLGGFADLEDGGWLFENPLVGAPPPSAGGPALIVIRRALGGDGAVVADVCGQRPGTTRLDLAALRAMVTPAGPAYPGAIDQGVAWARAAAVELAGLAADTFLTAVVDDPLEPRLPAALYDSMFQWARPLLVWLSGEAPEGDDPARWLDLRATPTAQAVTTLLDRLNAAPTFGG